jgi:ribosomal protein L37E
VPVSPADVQIIDKLRKLRNDLQHGTASFGYRTGLSLCRKTLTFLDKFCHCELALWLGSIVPSRDWQALLQIPELSATADIVSAKAVAEIGTKAGVTITVCDRCGKPTMIRGHPTQGASCVRCGYVPVRSDTESSD